MKINNETVLLENLEQMETERLDAMLLEELRKEMPNRDLIRAISNVLKERESVLEVDEHIQKAWEQYQLKSQTIHKKPR